MFNRALTRLNALKSLSKPLFNRQPFFRSLASQSNSAKSLATHHNTAKWNGASLFAANCFKQKENEQRFNEMALLKSKVNGYKQEIEGWDRWLKAYDISLDELEYLTCSGRYGSDASDAHFFEIFDLKKSPNLAALKSAAQDIAEAEARRSKLQQELAEAQKKLDQLEKAVPSLETSQRRVMPKRSNFSR